MYLEHSVCLHAVFMYGASLIKLHLFIISSSRWLGGVRGGGRYSVWIRDCLIVSSCPSSLTHCVVGLITGCTDDIWISVVGIPVHRCAGYIFTSLHICCFIRELGQLQ